MRKDDWIMMSPAVPKFEENDEGKVLKVQNGKLAWVNIGNTVDESVNAEIEKMIYGKE